MEIKRVVQRSFDAERRKALDELAAQSQELGMGY